MLGSSLNEAINDALLDLDFEIVEEAVEKGFSLTQTIGDLHPVLVHLPIGGMIIWFLFECCAFLNLRGFRDCSFYLALFVVASFVPAIATGILKAQEFESEALLEIALHEKMMLFAMIIAIFSLGVRAAFRRVTRLYLIFVCITLVLAGYGAHLGGMLVHGP